MSVEKIKLILSFAEFALFVVCGLYAWWNTRTRATQQHFSLLNAKVAGLDNRVGLVERDAANSPGHKELGEVHYRVDQVGQSVKRIEGGLEQINNTLALIQQSLLQDRK